MWGYYLTTGWRDTRRASRTLTANIFIVAGIGLPVLLLLGLQKGLVEQFRSDLQKSPTARMIQATAIGGEKFGRQLEKTLETNKKGIELVIPEISSTADLETAGPSPKSTRMTLSTTKPGDPLLGFYGLDLLKKGERAIIISKAVANALDLKYKKVGDRLGFDEPPQVILRVTRVGDEVAPGQQPGRTLPLIVRGVFEPGGSSTSSTAYLDRELMDQIQDYKFGRSVEALGWPGTKMSADVYYDGYLSFTETAYDSTDIDRLHGRGLGAKLLNPLGSSEEREIRQLYGLLKPHEHKVYQLRSERGGEPVRLEASAVESITPRGDIVIPWTPPTLRTIGGIPHRAIGVTVNARWLRSTFLNPATRLTSDPTEFQVLFPFGLTEGMTPGPVTLSLPGAKSPIPMTVIPLQPPLVDSRQLRQDARSIAGALGVRWPRLRTVVDRMGREDTARTPPLAVIPADLSAHLSDFDRGRLVFDTQLGLFALAPAENTYNEARVYAQNLDLIPEVDEYLRVECKYQTTSSKTRVQEMRKYSGTLDALVWTVLTAVLLFGTMTILFVFGDVTSRKRGAIGIMRIMGMPPTGIFGIVLVRALIVGLAGFVLTILSGLGLAQLLAFKYGNICIIGWEHVQQVFAVALLCCLLGVITPAWRAARLDPVDAISQSRTQ